MSEQSEPKSKRERRSTRTAAGGTAKAARAQTKERRRQARAGRKDAATTAVPDEPASEDQDGLEARLSRIEQALEAQAERSRELKTLLDDVLQEARKSARHSKAAAAEPSASSD
jgi:hypothetical protein